MNHIAPTVRNMHKKRHCFAIRMCRKPIHQQRPGWQNRTQRKCIKATSSSSSQPIDGFTTSRTAHIKCMYVCALKYTPGRISFLRETPLLPFSLSTSLSCWNWARHDGVIEHTMWLGIVGSRRWLPATWTAKHQFKKRRKNAFRQIDTRRIPYDDTYGKYGSKASSVDRLCSTPRVSTSSVRFQSELMCVMRGIVCVGVCVCDEHMWYRTGKWNGIFWV